MAAAIYACKFSSWEWLKCNYFFKLVFFMTTKLSYIKKFNKEYYKFFIFFKL